MAVSGKNLISSSHLESAPSILTNLFDSGQAEFPTRNIPISRVVDPLHVAYNHVLIEQYHAAMMQGDCFPPISVLRAGKFYLIADGHKRFKAYMQFSFDEITVEVWTLRRWMLDQWHQFTKKNTQIALLLLKSPFNTDARKEFIALLRSTLAHWKRVAISLFTSSKT